MEAEDRCEERVQPCATGKVHPLHPDAEGEGLCGGRDAQAGTALHRCREWGAGLV